MTPSSPGLIATHEADVFIPPRLLTSSLLTFSPTLTSPTDKILQILKHMLIRLHACWGFIRFIQVLLRIPAEELITVHAGP